jgi:Protein of unknown function (DUF3631)
VVQLQRKPRAASVARLRKRDSDEFALLRSQAVRWAADNFSRLTDPEPSVPEALNDRAADNWRPLLAIADLAGGAWPQRAREAACILSGEGHDTAVNVELLADIRLAFGEQDVIRSSDLVKELTADPERPWAEWSRGNPLTQKQLAGLLRPFGIISETVHPMIGLAHGKGYKRTSFEGVWDAYLPGQNPPSSQIQPFEACKRADADGMGTSADFRSVREDIPHGSKNDDLSYSHAGLHACTDRKAGNGGAHGSDQEITAPASASPSGVEEGWTCAATEGTGTPAAPAEPAPVIDPWKDLGIPEFLDRRRPSQGEEAPASEAVPADRGQPTSELQAQADERRLDVIFEKILQQHDAEDSEYYLANLEGRCEVSNKP